MNSEVKNLLKTYTTPKTKKQLSKNIQGTKLTKNYDDNSAIEFGTDVSKKSSTINSELISESFIEHFSANQKAYTLTKTNLKHDEISEKIATKKEDKDANSIYAPGYGDDTIPAPSFNPKEQTPVNLKSNAITEKIPRIDNDIYVQRYSDSDTTADKPDENESTEKKLINSLFVKLDRYEKSICLKNVPDNHSISTNEENKLLELLYKSTSKEMHDLIELANKRYRKLSHQDKTNFYASPDVICENMGTTYKWFNKSISGKLPYEFEQANNCKWALLFLNWQLSKEKRYNSGVITNLDLNEINITQKKLQELVCKKQNKIEILNQYVFKNIKYNLEELLNYKKNKFDLDNYLYAGAGTIDKTKKEIIEDNKKLIIKLGLFLDYLDKLTRGEEKIDNRVKSYALIKELDDWLAKARSAIDNMPTKTKDQKEKKQKKIENINDALGIRSHWFAEFLAKKSNWESIKGKNAPLIDKVFFWVKFLTNASFGIFGVPLEVFTLGLGAAFPPAVPYAALIKQAFYMTGNALLFPEIAYLVLFRKCDISPSQLITNMAGAASFFNGLTGLNLNGAITHKEGIYALWNAATGMQAVIEVQENDKNKTKTTDKFKWFKEVWGIAKDGFSKSFESTKAPVTFINSVSGDFSSSESDDDTELEYFKRNGNKIVFEKNYNFMEEKSIKKGKILPMIINPVKKIGVFLGAFVKNIIGGVGSKIWNDGKDWFNGEVEKEELAMKAMLNKQSLSIGGSIKKAIIGISQTISNLLGGYQKTNKTPLTKQKYIKTIWEKEEKPFSLKQNNLFDSSGGNKKQLMEEKNKSEEDIIRKTMIPNFSSPE